MILWFHSHKQKLLEAFAVAHAARGQTSEFMEHSSYGCKQICLCLSMKVLMLLSWLTAIKKVFYSYST